MVRIYSCIVSQHCMYHWWLNSRSFIRLLPGFWPTGITVPTNYIDEAARAELQYESLNIRNERKQRSPVDDFDLTMLGSPTHWHPYASKGHSINQSLSFHSFESKRPMLTRNIYIRRRLLGGVWSYILGPNRRLPTMSGMDKPVMNCSPLGHDTTAPEPHSAHSR